jgi:type III secretion protein T
VSDTAFPIISINQVLAMPLALALPRIGAALYALGILPRTVPLIARGALAISIALFAQPMVADQIFATDQKVEIGAYLPIALKEALLGLLIGLTFSLPLRIFETAGGLLDFQSGSSTGAIMDPVTNTEVGPYGRLLLQIGIVLFIASGGLLAMTGVLAESFKVWPVMSFFPTIGVPLRDFAVKFGSVLLTYAVAIGLSVALLLLVVELGIGFINRITPQLNVFSFAMGIKSVLVSLTLIVVLPFAYDGMKNRFNGSVNKLVDLDAALSAPAKPPRPPASAPPQR